MQGKYAIIRDAIQNRLCVLARRRGLWLTLSPYMLGWRDDDPWLVAYAAAGTPAWLSLPVVELLDVRLTDGQWMVGPPVPPAEMEMDEVEVMAQA
jgi:hypothetical protein